MKYTMKYTELKERLINELTRSAEAHEAGQIWQIDGAVDELEAAILIDNDEPEFDKLKIALEFWSGWIDSRNHDWLFYKGIDASDWPQLAKLIVNDLRADRETTDERVREHFDYRVRTKRPGYFERLARLFRRKNDEEQS